MRLAFGLLGILGTLIAIVFFWSSAYLPYTQQVVSQGQSAQTTAERLAGIDTQLGGRVSEHVSFEPVERGGRLYGLAVRGINAGSSYQAYYGIQPGDMIDQVGPQMVRDMDAEMAKALALESYQRKWDLGVQRAGRRYMLPRDTALLPPPSARPLASPAAPTNPAAPANPAQFPQQGLAQQPAGQNPGTPPAPQPAQPAQPAQPSGSPLQRQLDAIRSFSEDGAQ